MKRSVTLSAAALALAAVLGQGPAFAQAKKDLVVTEPLHSTGYLPLYIAIRNGYFGENGLEVKVTLVDSASGHTNAVLSGQAFAFIGGPEHNAFAKLKGGELRSVVNVVDRGMTYLVSAKGQKPASGQSMTEFAKGKRFAVAFYSNSPNSVLRYLLKGWKLDPKSDVSLLEMASSAVIAPVKAGQANMAMATEPLVTRGVREGVWDEPLVNVPKELGPFAYSTMNVRQASIKDDPETVRKFVAAMVKALKVLYDKPDEAFQVARKEFPTMPEADLKATMDRSFADQIWSKDGTISEQSWKTAQAVATEAGLLKQDVAYGQIIDMQFVKAAR